MKESGTFYFLLQSPDVANFCRSTPGTSHWMPSNCSTEDSIEWWLRFWNQTVCYHSSFPYKCDIAYLTLLPQFPPLTDGDHSNIFVKGWL